MRVKHVVADMNVFFKVAEKDHAIAMRNTQYMFDSSSQNRRESLQVLTNLVRAFATFAHYILSSLKLRWA